MMKAIAAVAVLTAGPALAADAANTSAAAVEPQPPCTGECAAVFLQVQDQCVWASNGAPSPVVLALTPASGAPMQVMLKSGTSYAAADAPYDNKQCDSIEAMQQIINEHTKGTIITGPDPMAQQLQKCHADEMAARDANLKKDAYYDNGSRVVVRKTLTGGSIKSMQSYPVYWQRLKTGGGACLAALHDVKSYNAATSETIGSWVVSSADRVVTAVLTPSAIASLAAAAATDTAQLQLQYRRDSLFENSTIVVTSHSGLFPPSYTFDVLADGKDVGQFHGNETGIATGDLRAIFGADLAGLAPVRKLTVVTNSTPAGPTTLFATDVQQTAAALAAMKAFADAM